MQDCSGHAHIELGTCRSTGDACDRFWPMPVFAQPVCWLVAAMLFYVVEVHEGAELQSEIPEKDCCTCLHLRCKTALVMRILN
mmetsp:Transcript_92509/g.144337  ORF Transcript_92509/g.144337 Transcript_92509/m.144337 type:complete len:83 (+) Transcript_92509:119-367(+)